MKSVAMLVGLLVLGLFTPAEKKKIKIFMAGDSTMSIKETKFYPETGWGMPFVHFWDSSLTVVNKSKNGRSTKSFRAEGLWQEIMTGLSEGDFVIIQFGHNDEAKEKVERYTTAEEFSANLERYITEVRAKKATPILLTPVARRKFDSTGQLVDTHLQYSELVRKVAQKTQVDFLDIDKASQDLYRQFGVENSKWLFLQLAPGEHPNYPNGKVDNTHFNELGARLVAQLVLKELKAKLPALATYIKSSGN